MSSGLTAIQRFQQHQATGGIGYYNGGTGVNKMLLKHCSQYRLGASPEPGYIYEVEDLCQRKQVVPNKLLRG